MKHAAHNDNNFLVAGIMSGTSLDGVDLAFCNFSETEDGRWSFELHAAATIPYSAQWRQKLSGAHRMSAAEISRLHVEYGKFLGKLAADFSRQKGLSPCLIGSHGHTIFHKPEQGVTLQIGSGAEIAAQTGITTICDFRTHDVALGGQGAPLVPIGDQYLFGDYDVCLNLGGFSNFSFDDAGIRKASDICPVNIVLNHLAQSEGIAYDKDGEIAASGQVNPDLLARLNKLDFYRQPAPKSLGREWLEAVFFPALNSATSANADLMRTVVEHVAIQIATQTTLASGKTMLVTGGGAHNKFLMGRIADRTEMQIIKPENGIVDFKEALIFAFMAFLRLKGKVNCLSSVTGASADHSSGAVYGAFAGLDCLLKPFKNT